jgi:hypothetical protein
VTKQTFSNGLSVHGLLLTIALVLLVATAGWAASYVSYNGEFSLQYPDDWYQVDYNTVDAFLYRHQVDSTAYDYEAVLAHQDFTPFFAGPYVMMSLDTTAELSEREIDSVIWLLAGDYRDKIFHMATAEFLSEWRANRPNYDSATKIASFCTDIPEANDQTKKNLVMMRFYEKGVASFFFYAPDTLYDGQIATFLDVVTSLSTEDYKQASAKESVKVADIDTDDDSSSGVPIAVWAGLAVVLILLAARLRRKKRS